MFILDAIEYVPLSMWILLLCIVTVEVVVIEYLSREFKGDIDFRKCSSKVQHFQFDYLKNCHQVNADCSPDDINKMAKKYGLNEYETYLAVRHALNPRNQKNIRQWQNRKIS